MSGAILTGTLDGTLVNDYVLEILSMSGEVQINGETFAVILEGETRSHQRKFGLMRPSRGIRLGDFTLTNPSSGRP